MHENKKEENLPLMNSFLPTFEKLENLNSFIKQNTCEQHNIIIIKSDIKTL